MRATTFALAVLLVLSGCVSPTPTPTDTPSQTPTPTPTTTTDTVTTETATTGPFDATVAFDNCTTAVVEASQYEWVVVVTSEGHHDYRGDYSGTHTFSAPHPIQRVLVTGESGQVETSNPAFDACIDAQTATTKAESTTTATTEPTTLTATPTLTTKATTTTTARTTKATTTTTARTSTTTTTTATPTETPTPRPTVSEHKISVSTQSETTGENATAEYIVRNHHNGTVEFDFDVLWYTDRNGGDDFMEGVNRTHLTLAAGEETTVRASYQGNESIDTIDYAVNGLERTEG